MNTYTYTIFDANPATSGPCSWPHEESVEARAKSAHTLEKRIMPRIMREARQCGEYDKGHRIWIIIWNDCGISELQQAYRV